MNTKALALALLVAAAGLGYWGYDESQALGNRLGNALTGDMSDKVIMLYIGAAICAALAGFFLTRRGS